MAKPKHPSETTTDALVAEPHLDLPTSHDEASGEETSGEATAEKNSAEEKNAGERFVGQWNRLISTTNWEKGRIICQWREALMASGVAVTEYSDEAWAQLVGNVTSQHVGRLRRVFQRYGDVFDQYEGLYWSHFQASLDWEDAEMWLEGSLQNNWSVSQMRGKRWETHGTPPSEQQAELSADKDSSPSEPSASSADSKPVETADSGSLAAQTTEVAATPESELPKTSDNLASPSTNAAPLPAPTGTRLTVDVESLPDDVAEAFEQFKLAIIAHRREGWRDTTTESIVECLDSLKELALAD